MPGTVVTTIGLALIAALAGAAVGWMLHVGRCRRRLLDMAAREQEKLENEERVKERLRRQIRNLATRLDAARRGERDALGRLARTEADMADALSRADEASAGLAECQAALSSSNRKRDELHRQLRRLLAHSRELMAGQKERDEKIFTLSRQLSSWQERLPPLVWRFREKEREATAAHRALDMERERSRELEDTLRTRSLAHVAAVEGSGDDRVCAEPAEADDGELERIRGIGPTLARRLNELGIHRLGQVADFGPEDIRRVEDALADLAANIEPDDWVEQARRLVDHDRQEAGEASWIGRTET